ncbi:MAG: DUF2079 domain-containing protein, partial [Flavobacteriales bacterium]|nr:DUF2079 domain-containing protein [Flavobacteriales bacterium]
MKLLSKIHTWPIHWLIIAFFGVIFCLISLVNHYCYRTFGLDLGIYTHGIYCYSHLHFHNFTLGLEGVEINHLGNHFSPIIILVSPLYYLFGSYTLLVVQIASILFGGLGVYRFAKERLSGVLPELITVLFFSMWGIYSALAYDFHANVLAAMFAPWFILYFERGNRKMAVLMFVLVLVCKENMALWMACIAIGLGLKQLFTADARRKLVFTGILMSVSLLYFLVVQTMIMPALNPTGISDHLGNYSHLGDGPGGFIKTILTKPRYVFYLLFESLQVDELTFKLKSQLHFMVLVSGGIALVYRPHYMIMLAPIYAQKMLSSNMTHWGVYAQYSIEFAPIIALAFTEWLQHLRMEKLKLPLIVGTILAASFFNWHPTRPNTGFYSSEHYSSGLNLNAVNGALDAIP